MACALRIRPPNAAAFPSRLLPAAPARIMAFMVMGSIEKIGLDTKHLLAAFGDFWRFFGRIFLWMGSGWMKWRNIRTIFPQMYEIGVRSVPVVSVTGAFIGMVMAVEMYAQFKAVGQAERLGTVIDVSVCKQIGPILTAVMLAGRIGGALAAELGTMNVTEQLDALRVMGADPVRVLVVPRFLACVLLTPILTIYSDILGILGGWFIAVNSLGIPNQPYWHFAQLGVGRWAIMEGVIKSIFFGASIGAVSCYKGFTCGSGASGVGRACTDSFVATFISIIIMNFFFAQLGHDWYQTIYGFRGIFGG